MKSISLHHDHLTCHVVGDDSPYTTIPSPRRSGGSFGKLQDAVEKLQRVINDKSISDDFLYMYDDTFILSPFTYKDFYIDEEPKRGSSLWAFVWWTTRYMLGPQFYNYSTHYPIMFNKHKLQNIIDSYPQPYLMELLYLNLHGNPVPMDNTFLFTRDSYFVVPDSVNVLNVKNWSLCLEKYLQYRLCI